MPTAAPGMRSSPCSVGWSPWVGWWPRRSRVEGSCHQTRELGHGLLTCYAALCIAMRGEVRGGECAHRKSSATAPSSSASPAAMMRGSHASSCDQTSTPRGQQGGWTATGGTPAPRAACPCSLPSVARGEGPLAWRERAGELSYACGRCSLALAGRALPGWCCTGSSMHGAAHCVPARLGPQGRSGRATAGPRGRVGWSGWVRRGREPAAATLGVDAGLGWAAAATKGICSVLGCLITCKILLTTDYLPPL